MRFVGILVRKPRATAASAAPQTAPAAHADSVATRAAAVVVPVGAESWVES